MTSRAKLYARGEPFGESCTRMEGGRRIYGGGGGDGGGGSSSSSTSSSNQTTTNNVDKRLVLDQGIAISSDSSTVTVNALDAGIVTKALDTVSAADATAGAGFNQLLTLADKLFTAGGDILNKTQDSALSQIAAVNTAKNDSKGSIDQKTIIIIAIAGAAAYVASKRG